MEQILNIKYIATDGWIALSIAAQNGHYKTVHLLIKAITKDYENVSKYLAKKESSVFRSIQAAEMIHLSFEVEERKAIELLSVYFQEHSEDCLLARQIEDI